MDALTRQLTDQGAKIGGRRDAGFWGGIFPYKFPPIPPHLVRASIRLDQRGGGLHLALALTVAGAGLFGGHFGLRGAGVAGFAAQADQDFVEVAVRFERQRQGRAAVEDLVESDLPVIQRGGPGLAVALDLAGGEGGVEFVQQAGDAVPGQAAPRGPEQPQIAHQPVAQPRQGQGGGDGLAGGGVGQQRLQTILGATTGTGQAHQAALGGGGGGARFARRCWS